MGKGFIVLILVGAAFAYIVFNFVSDIEQNDPQSFGASRPQSQAYKKYYKKDVTGDTVLDLSGVPISKAKKVWAESPIRAEALENFPNFEMMRDVIESRLTKSPFRDYLLRKLDDVETDFLGGSIDSSKARERLTNP